jgi:hypothetical protein
MSCYTYMNMFNPFGLRIGVDCVYSETYYKNPNKTTPISLNNTWITLYILMAQLNVMKINSFIE